MVEDRLILEATGSGVISGRVARDSTLAKDSLRSAFRWVHHPFKAADPRGFFLPPHPRGCLSTDERRTKEIRRRQSAKLARHHHPQQGEYLGSVEAPDRERAEAIAIKQFALDDDQRNRLLIRERQ